MAPWLPSIAAIVIVIVAAPAVVWLARRLGGRARGAIGIAALMMGLGEVMDPPSKHLIEANEGEEKQTPTPGDPPTV